jgi:hypothetical protein
MEWLIENGQPVLGLDYPMVVFAERHLIVKIVHERAIRGLYNKTHVVEMAFEDLPHYSEWRTRTPQPALIENRDRDRDQLDNFSINWEKPGLIAKVAAENPFGTTHVGWCNLGIQNVKVFDFEGWEDAFDPPDKVRIHQQRYLSHAMVEDPAWYRYGRCVTAGGFLTGSVAAIQELATDFYAEFERAASLGFWPGDEDVLGYLLVHQPEKYVVSYGDYGQLLCNAKRPRRGGGGWGWEYNRSLYWMLGQALEHGDRAWASNLWRAIMAARRDNYFEDDTSLIEPLSAELGG